MQVRTKYLITYFILLVCFLNSCQSDYEVSKNIAVPLPWDSHHPINFEFQINDTIATYSFYISVRNNEEYPFSNIYFFINTLLPDGKSARDTVECILANPSGKWLGKGMGNLKESTHLIRNNLIFPRSGTYRMEIEQAMRVDELSGIKDVGIKIMKK